MIVSVLVPQWLRLDQIMSGNHNVVGINLRRKSVAVALPHFNLFLMNESASGTFDVLLEFLGHWRIAHTLKELDALLPFQVFEPPVVHQEG